MGTCILLRNSVFIGHASSPLNLCKGGFPSGAANAGDPVSVPGLGRSLGEGKGYPLQYSGWENSMEWQTVGHD